MNRKKRVFLVRHAETKLNVALSKKPDFYHHQTPDDPLTKTGEAQAKKLADRLRNIDFEYIITSPYSRARHTAKIINEVHNRQIETSDLFVEVTPPSEFNGKAINSPEVLSFREKVKANFNNPNWRFSNEENFHDRKSRARNALNFISNHAEQKILVVSHGAFLKIMGAYVLHVEKLNLDEYNAFIRHTSLENTGISIFDYFENGKWKIITWNDAAHVT